MSAPISEDQLEFVLSKMVEVSCQQPGQIIPSQQIGIWANGLMNDEFFNLLGLKLADHYATGKLSYDDADAVINDLWCAFIEGIDADGFDLPEPFFSIYLAFDAGEYSRIPGQNPVKEFTDPQIATILSKQWS